jgi:hypothetical protein
MSFTSSGLESPTFPLVALCLNHHATTCFHHYIYIYCGSLSLSIYIYIYRERERERERDGSVIGTVTGMDNRDVGVRVPLRVKSFHLCI